MSPSELGRLWGLLGRCAPGVGELSVSSMEQAEVPGQTSYRAAKQ